MFGLDWYFTVGLVLVVVFVGFWVGVIAKEIWRSMWCFVDDKDYEPSYFFNSVFAPNDQDHESQTTGVVAFIIIVSVLLFFAWPVIIAALALVAFVYSLRFARRSQKKFKLLFKFAHKHKKKTDTEKVDCDIPDCFKLKEEE